jgi:hypothetical protein
MRVNAFGVAEFPIGYPTNGQLRGGPHVVSDGQKRVSACKN